jgi:hypothetical protein
MKTLTNPADQQEILHRIDSLSENDGRKWGKMSVNQMLCHLTDSYLAGLGEKTISSATGFWQRTLIKWVALRGPFKWNKGFPTRPEMEQGRGGTPPVKFIQDRQKLISTFQHFCSELKEPCLPHPVFGPMTREDWWRWGYLHADHHLRQFGR